MLVHAGPLTERQILAKLFPDSDDLNKVRPRCTEMVIDHWLKEVSEAKDVKSHKTVRRLRAMSDTERDAAIEAERRNAGQLELLKA